MFLAFFQNKRVDGKPVKGIEYPSTNLFFSKREIEANKKNITKVNGDAVSSFQATLPSNPIENGLEISKNKEKNQDKDYHRIEKNSRPFPKDHLDSEKHWGSKEHWGSKKKRNILKIERQGDAFYDAIFGGKRSIIRLVYRVHQAIAGLIMPDILCR